MTSMHGAEHNSARDSRSDAA
ncbi:hypothetical protein XACJK48_9760002 [Xanthomonas citri pv. citri]|nr:hypothetical protein XACLE3_8550002 [Xanthomonas citri pv. citri]CEH61783.1 hypothetical protein XACJK48_9760002 [Xanthomonas citri pv. citri]CEL49738.1 hypothetical protein XACJM35_3030002 [Xanthomonas citri pv. citri]